MAIDLYGHCSTISQNRRGITPAQGHHQFRGVMRTVPADQASNASRSSSGSRRPPHWSGSGDSRPRQRTCLAAMRCSCS
jgi:hypothetical protein